MTKIIALDTETTGLDHLGVDEIFEIGIAVIDPGGATHPETALLCPRPSEEAVAQMHPEALKVNRYHERTSDPDWMWDTDAYVGEILHQIFDSRSVHIVGAVPWFDANFIVKWFRERDWPAPIWHYHFIDVEALAVGHLNATAKAADLPLFRVKPPYDSEEISELLGVTPPDDEHRHTALGDALWARDIYRRVMA